MTPDEGIIFAGFHPFSHNTLYLRTMGVRRFGPGVGSVDELYESMGLPVFRGDVRRAGRDVKATAYVVSLDDLWTDERWPLVHEALRFLASLGADALSVWGAEENKWVRIPTRRKGDE